MSPNDFTTDALERAVFAERLNSFIQVEHRFVDGSLVIALGSKFGSGKSTFLHMWANQLRTQKPLGDITIVPLSAWDSDYYNDPLFALISTIVEHTRSSLETKGLVSAIKDFAWAGLGALNQVAAEKSGIDILAAGDFAAAKKTERESGVPVTADAFSAYQERKSAMAAVKKELKKLFGGNEPKAVFIIDELDRCRPDYAVSFLEVIKHIFDISGIVFILSADRNQLENSARTAFGQDLDFNEYYRKFIHREIQLPNIGDQAYFKISTQLADKYLGKSSGRKCVFDFSQHRIKNIAELFAALNCTPRQIHDCFRLLGHHVTAMNGQDGQTSAWCEAVATILMAGPAKGVGPGNVDFGPAKGVGPGNVDFRGGRSLRVRLEWRLVKGADRQFLSS